MKRFFCQFSACVDQNRKYLQKTNLYNVQSRLYEISNHREIVVFANSLYVLVYDYEKYVCITLEQGKWQSKMTNFFRWKVSRCIPKFRFVFQNYVFVFFPMIKNLFIFLAVFSNQSLITISFVLDESDHINRLWLYF